MNQIKTATKRLSNRLWRLNNLYYIIDKQGNKVQFKLNWAQQKLYDDIHYCNIVLKARQLGMSTFIVLLFLDTCLFNSFTHVGIIAHTRESAEMLFEKAKFSYDNLPEELKKLRQVSADNVREFQFNNGSKFRVGTSLRGETFSYLHISEFGKICAKYPEKAREIITGSLNTIEQGQYTIIESTAEGREGYFYDLCKKAQETQLKGKNLTPLDYKFHFFPWWRNQKYKLKQDIEITPDLEEYFSSLQLRGVVLSQEQKRWYAVKKMIQKEDMLREFPSTPEEAFFASSESSYYAKEILKAKQGGRITNVSYDVYVPSFSSWDLGIGDSTAIWIFQVIREEIHLIDYIEDSGKPLTHYVKLLKDMPYTFEKHFVPHDAAARELSTGLTRIEVASNLGITFTLAPRLTVQEGIDAVKNIMHKCWFDEKNCDKGLIALENYKRKWNKSSGCWSEKPLHDNASHGADAFRMLAVSLNQTKKGMTKDDISKLREKAGIFRVSR